MRGGDSLARNLVEPVPRDTIDVGCIGQKCFGRVYHAIENVLKTLRSVTHLTLDKGIGWRRMRTLFAGAHCTGSTSLSSVKIIFR